MMIIYISSRNHMKLCAQFKTYHSKSNIGLVAISSQSNGANVTFASHPSSLRDGDVRSSSRSLLRSAMMLFEPELNAEELLGLMVSFGLAKSLSFSLTIADSSDKSSLSSNSWAPAVVSGKSPNECL